jgi:hypothetical protein
MNILDAFIKKHGQIILVIIGKPCTNKSYIAKEFADDLKLPLINMNKYYVDGTYVEKTVNDTSYKLYDHPDNINWDAVNSEVETKKTERGGVVVYGNYLDSAKITFKPNFVFFVNMNNNLCKTILIKNKILPYSPLSLTNEPPINPDVDGEVEAEAEVEQKERDDDIDVEQKEGDEKAVVAEAEVGEEVVAEAEEEVVAEAGDEVVGEEVADAEEGDQEEEDWEQTIDDSNKMESIGAEGDDPGMYNEEEHVGGGDEGAEGEGDKEDSEGEGDKGEEEQLNNYFTNIFLPLYDDLITKVKINKFYNIKNGTKIDTIYDDMFDFLMALIEKDVSPPTKKEDKQVKESGKGKKGSKKRKGKKL